MRKVKVVIFRKRSEKTFDSLEAASRFIRRQEGTFFAERWIMSNLTDGERHDVKENDKAVISSVSLPAPL